jgi:hypothetical protein
LNPSRRGGKPATNRLSYGVALLATCFALIFLLFFLLFDPEDGGDMFL